jgi:hypothetical protein
MGRLQNKVAVIHWKIAKQSGGHPLEDVKQMNEVFCQIWL